MKPVNQRKPWTEVQDQLLRSLCRQGLNVSLIAPKLGRTEGACRSRAEALGIPCKYTDHRRGLRPYEPRVTDQAIILGALALADYVPQEEAKAVALHVYTVMRKEVKRSYPNRKA